MTAKSKNRLASLCLMMAGVVVIVLGLQACHQAAYAQGRSATIADPAQPQISEIVDLMTSSQYLPAIGGLLVLLIGFARAGLTKIKWHGIGAWFSSQLGGYALAYGCTLGLYLGTAFEQSQPVTMRLLLTAVGVALTTSGVLDHWRDILNALKKTPPTVATLALVLWAVGCSGCHQVIDSQPAHDVVSCVELNQDLLKSLGTECGAKIPDWAAAEACVVSKLPQAGWKVGGCVISQLVQEYLTKKGVGMTKDTITLSHDARDALEHYRANYAGGASFKTKQGEL